MFLLKHTHVELMKNFWLSQDLVKQTQGLVNQTRGLVKQTQGL